MKHHSNRTTVLFTILLVLASISPIFADGISWNTDFGTAVAQARQWNKPILVDMYTDWCGWCKKLDSDVYPDPNVVQAASQFIAVRLDAEKGGKDVAAHFGVTSYPTILFLTPSGQVIDRIDGYLPAPEFTADLNEVSQKFQSTSGTTTDVPPATRRTRAQPRAKKSQAFNVTRSIRLAVSLARSKKFGEAQTLVENLEQRGYSSKLGGVYNEFGDVFLAGGQDSASADWYGRTLQYSQDSSQVAHAHLQMAKYYARGGQLDYERQELRSIVASKGVPANYKTAAAAMLKKIR